jgi:alkanesulfonate monooxygenase SsuD/methylene tetrahydromethanopterin reductase-like flavin-dependent oxidoreductase (luciferase family)
MAKPKVIVQIYPMLPAVDRADRERKRPLGRNSEVYHEVLHEMHGMVKEIDQMGVWGISTIEHHLHSEGYEVGPNPGVLNAFWMSQVKNAYVGALGYVMPTRDPIRVAEETAILDHMAHGKFFVGLTRGYQSRWTNMLGQHIAAPATCSDGSADDLRNREIFEERCETLLKCWTEESVEVNGPTYQIPYPYDTGVVGYPARKSIFSAGAAGEVDADGNIRRACVVPSLYTKPHPPVFVPMSGSRESIPFLAKHGFRPTYFTPMKQLVDFGHYYVEEAQKAGHDFAFGERQNICRWVHVGDTEAEWREKIRRYEAEMYAHHYTTFYPGKLPAFDDEQKTVQAMIDSGIFMGGNVEQLKEKWRNIYAQMPTEYITLVNHYAQIPKDILLEELHVFMTQVLPELDTPYETDKAA